MPAGGLRASPLGVGAITTDDLRPGYSIDVISKGLPNANGGHWLFAAGTAAAVRGDLYPPPPITPADQSLLPRERGVSLRALRLGQIGGLVAESWIRTIKMSPTHSPAA